MAGLGFAEFWELTPADVALAMDAHEARERAAYWRAGLITAAVINAHRQKGRPAKPEDFVPEPRASRRAKAVQTPQQMAAALRAMTLAMGGTVGR